LKVFERFQYLKGHDTSTIEQVHLGDTPNFLGFPMIDAMR
jgi:hypothetical protein